MLLIPTDIVAPAALTLVIVRGPFEGDLSTVAAVDCVMRRQNGTTQALAFTIVSAVPGELVAQYVFAGGEIDGTGPYELSPSLAVPGGSLPVEAVAMFVQTPWSGPPTLRAVTRLASTVGVPPATRNLFLTVANGPALGAAQAVGLPIGQLAFVQSRTTLWSYQPGDSAAADGSHIPALGGGNWVYHSAGNAPAALEQTSWWIDPVHGSDDATGLTMAAAVQTFAELVRRMGSLAPALRIFPTIQVLSSMPASDSIVFRPQLIGPDAGLVIQGTLTPTGGPLTLATFTPANTAAGQLARIAVAGHGAWTPGTLIHTGTSLASFAIVEDLGGGAASITTPYELPVIDDTPTALTDGESLQIMTPSVIAITALAPVSDGAGDGAVLQQCIMTAQGAVLAVAVLGGELVLAECIGDGNTEYAFLADDIFECNLISVFLPDIEGSGAFEGCAAISGGCLMGAGNFFQPQSTLYNDVVIPLRSHSTGELNIAGAYMGQWIETDVGDGSNAHICVGAFEGIGFNGIWGPATIAPHVGQEIVLFSVTAVGALQCTGGITIDGQATAFPWVAATHSYGPAVAITAAAIDTAGGLANPATGTSIHF